MFAETSVNVDVGQIIFAATALIAAFGVPAILSARSAAKAAKSSEKVEKEVDTGNGQKLGAAVHDMAQTIEILSAQVHTNTQETVALSEKVDAHIVDSANVHDRLLNELGASDRREPGERRESDRRGERG